MSNQNKCPKCGNRSIQVSVQQWIDVDFYDDGHQVADGPNGDHCWEDSSHVICSTHMDGCGWSGRMSEFNAGTVKS